MSSLHLKTPLIFSEKLTNIFGKGPVYLKLDNLQPSGSFKIRGLGATCQVAKSSGAVKLVGSSGGNGGLAMAYAARKIELPIVIFVPTSTPQMMVDKIKAEGADVRVTGSNWDAANSEALNFVKSEPGAFFVHPYDQATSWSGHSTIITEIKDQLKEDFNEDLIPAAIVSCVGGGGLAIGILQGLENVGWVQAPVILMETFGANCFNLALQAAKPIVLDSITSVAKSLGALQVSQKLFDLSTRAENQFTILSRVVEDKDAVTACLRFMEDHRMIVEPACGAVLSAIYNKKILRLDEVKDDGPIVVIVCGGNVVSLELIDQWKNQFDLK